MKTLRLFLRRWKSVVFVILLAFDLFFRSGKDLSFLLVGLFIIDTYLEGNTPALNKSFWSECTEVCTKKQILHLVEF
jgi:hypothetical protein